MSSSNDSLFVQCAYNCYVSRQCADLLPECKRVWESYDMIRFVNEQLVPLILPVLTSAFVAAINPYVGIMVAIAGALATVRNDLQAMIYTTAIISNYFQIMYWFAKNVFGDPVTAQDYINAIKMAFTKPIEWSKEVLYWIL